MKFFAAYLKQRRMGIVFFGLSCLIFLCAFALYHLPAGAVWYPALVCVLLGALFLGFDIHRAYRKHRQLLELQKLSAETMADFPAITALVRGDGAVLPPAGRQRNRLCDQRL